MFDRYDLDGFEKTISTFFDCFALIWKTETRLPIVITVLLLPSPCTYIFARVSVKAPILAWHEEKTTICRARNDHYRFQQTTNVRRFRRLRTFARCNALTRCRVKRNDYDDGNFKSTLRQSTTTITTASGFSRISNVFSKRLTYDVRSVCFRRYRRSCGKYRASNSSPKTDPAEQYGRRVKKYCSTLTLFRRYTNLKFFDTVRRRLDDVL